jgi:hypothetical protein
MSRSKILLTILVAIASFLVFPTQKIFAESQTNCPERYATLVNPVRGRSLWSDESLKPLTDQYLAAAKYSFPITWLLQYDALTDKELVNKINSFEVKGEEGVFLEVSRNLADSAGVIYPSNLKWSDPGVVFLSAYSQSERKLLIDTIFSQFKKDFGYYPKSVGAWWIDSYSLNYIKQKYGLSAILIVADQKTTDNYGVWGQWWGYPYYPSKYNVLTPAINNPLGAVVIQWAQRDPTLAYGVGPSYSNFSLQANDYIRNGKNTNFFKNLVNLYLGCQNSIGQVTVGMETGMEAIAFQEEYLNQLQVLSGFNNLKVVTMSNFAKDYENISKKNPQEVLIGGWNLTPSLREDSALGDIVTYNENISFGDYFAADKSSFLQRSLPVAGPKNSIDSFQWFWFLFLVLGVLALWKRKFTVWVCSSLFAAISFGLVFKSSVEHGWQVFYGPFIKQTTSVQLLLVLIVFLLFFLIFVEAKVKFKNINLFMWLLPLSFGLDKLALILRRSIINGNYFIGFLVDRTRIVGLTIGKTGLNLFNQRLSILQVSAFNKLPFDKIWQNIPLYFILYPLAHILFAIILYFLLIRVPKRVGIFALFFLAIFFVMQILWIFNVDPRLVLPAIN